MRRSAGAQPRCIARDRRCTATATPPTAAINPMPAAVPRGPAPPTSLPTATDRSAADGAASPNDDRAAAALGLGVAGAVGVVDGRGVVEGLGRADRASSPDDGVGTGVDGAGGAGVGRGEGLAVGRGVGGAASGGGATPGGVAPPVVTNDHPSTAPSTGREPAGPAGLYAQAPPRGAVQYDQYAVAGGVDAHDSASAPGRPSMRHTNPGIVATWVTANPASARASTPELGVPGTQRMRMPASSAVKSTTTVTPLEVGHAPFDHAAAEVGPAPRTRPTARTNASAGPRRRDRRPGTFSEVPPSLAVASPPPSPRPRAGGR